MFRDLEELKELSRAKMFGRPGHGAPTTDIRKKKFTEHQINNLTRSHSLSFGLDSDNLAAPAQPVSRSALTVICQILQSFHVFIDLKVSHNWSRG